MGQIIHGKNLIVKLDGEAVAACTACSIELQCDVIETTSPTSGRFKEYLAGRCDWSVNSQHLVTHGIMLSAASLIGRRVEVQFSYCENALHTDDGVVMRGDAIINRMQVDAQVGSLAKGSFGFKGSGALDTDDRYTYLVPNGNDGLTADGRKMIVRKYEID